MNIANLKLNLVFVLFWGLFMMPNFVFAQDNVLELKKQIEELKARVAELEANHNNVVQKSPVPAVLEQDQWDPWDEMGRMHSQMEQMFQNIFDQKSSSRQGMFSNQLFFDASKVEETKDGYSIKLDIGGFDRDKIDIKAQEGTLIISGEYKSQDKKENQNSIFEAHNFGKFLNTIPLPSDADVSGMKTEKKGDQVVIFLPKKK